MKINYIILGVAVILIILMMFSNKKEGFREGQQSVSSGFSCPESPGGRSLSYDECKNGAEAAGRKWMGAEMGMDNFTKVGSPRGCWTYRPGGGGGGRGKNKLHGRPAQGWSSGSYYNYWNDGDAHWRERRRTGARNQDIEDARKKVLEKNKVAAPSGYLKVGDEKSTKTGGRWAGFGFNRSRLNYGILRHLEGDDSWKYASVCAKPTFGLGRRSDGREPVLPVQGGWGDWGPCSKTCYDISDPEADHGTQTRTCNKPTPAHGGRPCRLYNGGSNHVLGPGYSYGWQHTEIVGIRSGANKRGCQNTPACPVKPPPEAVGSVQGNIVTYNGYQYRTLTGLNPNRGNTALAFKKENEAGRTSCEKRLTKIPTGWGVAPYNIDSILIAQNYSFGTSLLVLASSRNGWPDGGPKDNALYTKGGAPSGPRDPHQPLTAWAAANHIVRSGTDGDPNGAPMLVCLGRDGQPMKPYELERMEHAARAEAAAAAVHGGTCRVGICDGAVLLRRKVPTPKCPNSWDQVGDIGADIGGCGMDSCDARYSKANIQQCSDWCRGDKRCKAFNWAPLNGDKNHKGKRVCTRYTSDNPKTKWAALDGSYKQIFCKPTPAPPPAMPPSPPAAPLLAPPLPAPAPRPLPPPIKREKLPNVEIAPVSNWCRALDGPLVDDPSPQKSAPWLNLEPPPQSPPPVPLPPPAPKIIPAVAPVPKAAPAAESSGERYSIASVDETGSFVPKTCQEDGKTEITTATECLAAGKKLAASGGFKRWGGVRAGELLDLTLKSSHGTHPKGCFTANARPTYLLWNTHATGCGTGIGAQCSPPKQLAVPGAELLGGNLAVCKSGSAAGADAKAAADDHLAPVNAPFVTYNGYDYRSLAGNEPTGNKPSQGGTCEGGDRNVNVEWRHPKMRNVSGLKVPAGWKIAPDEPDSREIAKQYSFQNALLVLATGDAIKTEASSPGRGGTIHLVNVNDGPRWSGPSRGRGLIRSDLPSSEGTRDINADNSGGGGSDMKGSGPLFRTSFCHAAILLRRKAAAPVAAPVAAPAAKEVYRVLKYSNNQCPQGERIQDIAACINAGKSLKASGAWPKMMSNQGDTIPAASGYRSNFGTDQAKGCFTTGTGVYWNNTGDYNINHHHVNTHWAICKSPVEGFP